MESFSSSSPLGQQIGSSQNQPKRKRGISALLGDITNDPSAQTLSRRTCREETLSKVAANLEQTHEPRGDASKGGKIKAKLAKNSSKPGNNTLHCIFTKQRELFDKGQEYINDFVSKNVSWELQKSIAIQIMTSAITTLNKGIVDAAKFAATTTGLSHEVIPRWAFGYLTGISEYPGSVDNLDLHFIMYAQIVVLGFDLYNAYTTRVDLYKVRLDMKMILSVYGLFSLIDIFQYVFPALCLSSQLKQIHVSFLGYISVFYPIYILIFLIWVCISLHYYNFIYLCGCGDHFIIALFDCVEDGISKVTLSMHL